MKKGFWGLMYDLAKLEGEIDCSVVKFGIDSRKVKRLVKRHNKLSKKITKMNIDRIRSGSGDIDNGR